MDYNRTRLVLLRKKLTEKRGKVRYLRYMLSEQDNESFYCVTDSKTRREALVTLRDSKKIIKDTLQKIRITEINILLGINS